MIKTVNIETKWVDLKSFSFLIENYRRKWSFYMWENICAKIWIITFLPLRLSHKKMIATGVVNLMNFNRIINNYGFFSRCNTKRVVWIDKRIKIANIIKCRLIFELNHLLRMTFAHFHFQFDYKLQLHQMKFLYQRCRIHSNSECEWEEWTTRLKSKLIV